MRCLIILVVFTALLLSACSNSVEFNSENTVKELIDRVDPKYEWAYLVLPGRTLMRRSIFPSYVDPEYWEVPDNIFLNGITLEEEVENPLNPPGSHISVTAINGDWYFKVTKENVRVLQSLRKYAISKNAIPDYQVPIEFRVP